MLKFMLSYTTNTGLATVAGGEVKLFRTHHLRFMKTKTRRSVNP